MQATVDTKVMNKKINRFITNVSDKYNLDSMELMALWFQTDEEVKFNAFIPKKIKKEPVDIEVIEIIDESVKPDPASVSVKQPVATVVFSSSSFSGSASASKAVVETEADVGGKKRKSKKECSYVLLRGPKKGEICGCTVKNPDNEFCPKHCDNCNEGEKIKEVPVEPPGTSTLLRKNKSIDKLWHESTGLVFESSTNRVVIGKCDGGELKPLSQNDIAVCKQNGFKFQDVQDVKVASNDVISDVEQILHGLSEPALKKGVDDNVGMSFDLSDDEEFLLEEE